MERSKDNHCGSSHRKERKKEKGTPPNKIQTQPNDQMKINKPLAPFSAAKFKKNCINLVGYTDRVKKYLLLQK